MNYVNILNNSQEVISPYLSLFKSMTRTPCDSINSLAPAKVSDSPTITFLIPNWTIALAQR